MNVCKRKTSLYKEHKENPERAMMGLLTTWCGKLENIDETTGRWADSDCHACQIAFKKDRESSKAYRKGKMVYNRSRQLYTGQASLQSDAK